MSHKTETPGPWALLLLSAFAAGSLGAARAWEASFEASEIIQISRTLQENERYRLYRPLVSCLLEGSPGPWSADLDLETEAFLGNYLETNEWAAFASPLLEGANRVRWHWNLSKSAQADWRARVRRLKLSAISGPVAFSAGRLRNSLGSSMVFLSPWDRADRLPTLISGEGQRPASDTAALRWQVLPALSLQSAYIWDKTPAESRYYLHARWRLIEGLEIGALSGKLEPRTQAAAAAVQKTLGESELRWESAFSRRNQPSRIAAGPGGAPVLVPESVKAFSRHALLWERAWSGEWATGLEYSRNGNGARKSDEYDLSGLLAGQDLYLGRDYAGASVSKTISSLWSAKAQMLGSLTDGSYAISPSLNYLSPSSRLAATLRLAIRQGPASGEFQRLPGRAEAGVSWFF
jgi:hypothetical protein